MQQVDKKALSGMSGLMMNWPDQLQRVHALQVTVCCWLTSVQPRQAEISVRVHVCWLLQPTLQNLPDVPKLAHESLPT